MSFFSALFSDDANKIPNNFPWIPMHDLGVLDEIVTSSHQKPVVIFKHSTRCSISKFALKNFENEYQPDKNIDFYLLDLIQFRNISNAIASKFEVVHQSPQILLIQNGVCTYHDSHQDIDFGKLALKVG